MTIGNVFPNERQTLRIKHNDMHLQVIINDGFDVFKKIKYMHFYGHTASMESINLSKPLAIY